MSRTKLAAIALAALLAVTGVAAAAPGNAPADAGANGTDAGQAGPPSNLPGPVPDFVSDIHDTIRSFLDGGIDNLGEAVSDIAGGENAENADEESADATSTATPA
ncbi:hypothetical protein [Halobaculum gomorrense]|uniref:Uncharacterized protein n=1 Tax=Halobaculum gomorrense TaxID=43928 RepID=A0A1M5JV72_9EURY|nr:hypothetical protein [Halobaculum gomorrense]SHG44444.1 hypothetical protein SAMN05443636_0278 [Halobaculum gomorrense]